MGWDGALVAGHGVFGFPFLSVPSAFFMHNWFSGHASPGLEVHSDGMDACVMAKWIRNGIMVHWNYPDQNPIWTGLFFEVGLVG